MKKFGIKKAGENKWVVLHHEFPKFTCTFENKKFYNTTRKIKGLLDYTAEPREVMALQLMEDWLVRNHSDKMD
ncbi:hypothetical protein [Flavobacterium hydatis]|uniref:Uncharacterized protein n=1 Tax=Flavobacterium hydatis TaxID=991 RepID=A0A086A5K4_FLAHY|nr:hypothetical protein [Flavobacterium hydatis]KFF11968.1 hypothetical protein IW20_18915 [Flavobacterium hydatis]OXA93900.1 hypothetical protein B0A62_12135 [Flavobacterium hydatis]